MRTELMYSFAEKFDLQPSEAMLLPGVFEVAAKAVRMDQERLIQRAGLNQELAEYIVELVKELAQTTMGKEMYEDFLEERKE